MQLISISFILIFILHKSCQVLGQSCPQNCLQCNDSGQCSECNSGYILDQNRLTCLPNCNFGQSFNRQSNSCQSICPSTYYSDSQTNSCQQMLPCPTMNQIGQNYFDVFLSMISTSSGKIIVIGMIGGNNSQSIIILDNQNYQPVGQLIGHDDGVIAIQNLRVNLINDLGNTSIQQAQFPQGQELLISVSRTQLIIWNLNYNQILFKILLPNSLVGYYKLTQISKDYIILMQNTDTLNNFAIVYLSEIVNQPIYKQQSTPTLISSSYKLFSNAHIKSINGILILPNYQLISYGQDNKIVIWSSINKPDNFQYQCSFSSAIDSVLQLSKTNYLIQVDNDYSLYIYNSSICTEIQTYHANPIQQILASPSPILQNIDYFFSCSSTEVILYIYDTNQQIYSYISQINSDNQYRFIANNYFVFISSKGNVSINQFDDSIGLVLIYTYNLYFTQLNPVNQVLINNQNLLILFSELTILQLTPLPSDPKQLPVQLQISDKKKNIKTKMKYHTDAVNGILFDRLYDRVITYSIDGSFKVWEERTLQNQGNVTDYRLVIEQFHPLCNILLDSQCQRQILDMNIVIPNLFACLYNDNTIILWNYNPFNVTLNATLSLDLKNLPINNMFAYKNTFIAYSNAKQLKVYNFITMSVTQVINDSFYYAVLENNNGVDYAYFIRANVGQVIIMNLATKAIYLTNSYSGNLGFAKYYPEIKYLFFSTVSNNILYIYPFLFSGVKRYSINQPVAISVDVVTKNFMVYQQNYNIAYFYWSGTTLYIYGTYTFSASIPQKLSAPLSNPEQHFFVQNTAFPAIQNQVISFSYQYNNQMLLTFSDKISSIALDPISRKMYLGFENGNLYSGGYSTNYYAYIDPAYYFNGIYYNQNDRSVYAFNNNIHQIDTTTMTKPKTYTGAHKSTINDIIIDTQNNWIVSYSNDTTNNFYRWDMNGTSFRQFTGGQTQNVIKAFLDLEVDRIISYSSDMTFAVWQYSNLTLLYTINTHILEQAKYNLSIASIPPDQQIPYKIVSYYHDPINKRIISVNNIQTVFMHYYCDIPTANPPIKQNTYTSYVIPNMIDLYVDQDQVYGKFYVKVLINMIYSLQTYNFLTFAYEQQLSYHTDNIQGMKYINTKSYSFQYTMLVIMDRKTQNFILSITTQNPLITNFIVFEKMDHIYLYSEWYKNVLSYRLAVHSLSTGQLIKQILNSQYIENGNVNMVFLDEEHYQLLIYKSLILNIFTVDVRTFSYTNYFTYKYNPPLKKVIFIKEHNLMCHIDAYYLEIYQMDFSFNTDKIALNVVQQKQPSYFYSQNSSMLYYIDVDNNAWQFGNQNQQAKFVQSLSLVRQTSFQNGFFYVITDQQIIQFAEIGSNLQQLNSVNIVVKNAYFLDQFIFCETFYFKLIKLSYNPLAQVQTFNFQFTNKVKQILSISNLNQIIVLLMDSSIQRIDVAADKLLVQYSSIANLNIINYDSVNQILIHHLETGAMIFYLDFATQSDYMNSQARKLQISNTDPINSLLFDYQYQRIFVLNVRKVIPKIRVYTYNVTTVNNTVQLSTPQLIKIIPPPTKAQHLVVKIYNNQLIVQAYFQINTYSLDKLQLLQNFRDNSLLQTLKSFEILNIQGQLYSYVTQYDSFSIFQQNSQTNTWNLINQIYQSYPNLASNTQILDPTTNYYSTKVIGISNGVYFNYNFFIQNQINSPQIIPFSSALSQLKCYYELPFANTLDKIQSQLKLFQFSFNLLNLKMQQTLFQFINANNLNGVSFSQVLNSYTSNFQTYYQYQGAFTLLNGTFVNSTNLQSPLILLKGNSYEVSKSTFTKISCLVCSGGALQVAEAQQLLLNFTEFTYCSASNGGALSISGSYYNLTQIYNSIFKYNNASLNGGAIYLDTTNLFMQNSTIQYNQAMIGGGIRYLKIEPVFIYMMKNRLNDNLTNQRRNLAVVQNVIQMNKATIHSNNFGSYVSNIKILQSSVVYLDITGNDQLPESVKNDKLNLQTCSVNRFQSGHYFNFQFQLLDDENNPLYFDIELVKKNMYPPSIQSEIMQFNIRADTNNTNIKIFGQYITDYLNFNSTSKSFQISQMQVIANPETQNIFYIESESILKVPYPTLQSRDIKSGPFHITFVVDFRECIIGELYRLQGIIYYCQECLDETYSIVEPDKENFIDQQCIRCPDQAEHCYRNQMTLKQGYWKSTNLTDSIVECSNKLSNCVGTEEQGYCLEGHIGPLCEQCDIQGKFWDQKYYSDGSFDCKKCSQLLHAVNLVPTIFIALGMIVYVLISIRIAWDISELIVIGYYLRRMKFAPVSKSSFLDTTNMNMKAMMNYVQISQLVNTVKVALPSWLTFFPEYVGNPVQNMIYTLDCYLVDVDQQDVPIVFMRILWGLSIPFLYLSGMSIIYFIFVKFKLMRHNLSYIYSGLVFLFIFMQPNMIQNLLGAMSCREIDNQKYILSDISFQCYTPNHKKFIGFILMPGLLIWGFIIPFFILFKLNKNKDKLDNAKIRLIYGFLYQDYKTRNFYWEFIKSYMKIVIVCIYNFYGDPYTNKLVIALIVFILYLVILVKFTPYQMIYFQKTDRNSMLVIIVLVIMNIFLYNKPDSVQSQIFYIILLGIHNGYLAFMFFEVIKAKIQISFKKQFDKIKEKLSQYCTCLKPYLHIKKNIRLSTFFRWKRIKNLLHSLKAEKERGIIRDKIFGLSSQLVSSQSNIQSPQLKSCDKLIGQEYAKSKFHDKLFNEQNKMEDSIKSIKMDNTISNNLDLNQQKHKIQLDQSSSTNQQSLQNNNNINNINQISISINNQTILIGSPLIQVNKDETNESQFKIRNAANNNNLSPILNNQSYEQAMMQSFNLNNSNLVKREGIISKSLKRVTQSTNITLSNNISQQLILNQHLQQQNLNNQSWQQIQNQIISTIDQSRTIENYLFFQESPLIIPKSEQDQIFSEQKSNNDQDQDKKIERVQIAKPDITESVTDSVDTKIIKMLPQNLENSTQGNYFLKEIENNSSEVMNHSQKQFDLIKLEQNDEINEQSINQSESIAHFYNLKSQETPQIENYFTPQYQDYYNHYQNYFNENQQIDHLDLNNQSDQNQPIECNNSNDVNIELQDLGSATQNTKSLKQLSTKQIKSAQDLETKEKVRKKSKEFKDDSQILDHVFTPKNIFGFQFEDSFEYQKQQTALSSILNNYKKVQSFKYDKKSTKIINHGTIIMDHQTIYTTDQGRIKSQSFGQGFENFNVGNTITAFSQKNENQSIKDQQEQTINQDDKKSEHLSFESFSWSEKKQAEQKKEKNIANEFQNQENDQQQNTSPQNE